MITTATENWALAIRQANDGFLELADEQLQLQIASGHNRLSCLLGHFAAVHGQQALLFENVG